MILSKSQMITIGVVFGLIWAVNNIDALEPVKEILEG